METRPPTVGHTQGSAETPSRVPGEAVTCGLVALGSFQALAHCLWPARSQEEAREGFYNIEVEVAILAAGPQTFRRASALRDWLAGANDDVITRLVLLEAADAHQCQRYSSTDARAVLERTLDASDLVVAVIDDIERWNPLFCGPDALISRVTPRNVVAVHPKCPGSEVLPRVREAAWPALLHLPSELAGFVGGCGEIHDMLPGVPEALLAAVTQPGLVCFDYADYINALGSRPGLACAGMGVASGANRVDEAADLALAQLHQVLPAQREVSGGLCIIGLPIDGAIPEVERACQRFESEVPLPVTGGCTCAAPLLPSDTDVLTCFYVVSTRTA